MFPSVVKTANNKANIFCYSFRWRWKNNLESWFFFFPLVFPECGFLNGWCHEFVWNMQKQVLKTALCPYALNFAAQTDPKVEGWLWCVSHHSTIILVLGLWITFFQIDLFSIHNFLFWNKGKLVKLFQVTGESWPRSSTIVSNKVLKKIVKPNTTETPVSIVSIDRVLKSGLIFNLINVS